MPVNIPDTLPAYRTLTKENIFVMKESRAVHQDIRPLKIAILNLMPIKITTEAQLLRLLSNSPIQIELTLLMTESYTGTNTPKEHLVNFYKTFQDIKDMKFDGMIVTGAPVEHMEFEDVAYWKEIERIIEWTEHHVTSTLYICWASQAALYYKFQIPKYSLPKKLFGVFAHTVHTKEVPLVRGFDDVFYAPHSRYTEIKKEDVKKHKDLVLVSDSADAGVYIVMDKSGRNIFVTGHSEYDPLTLDEEFKRDRSKGMHIDPPQNYYADEKSFKNPVVCWRGHSHLLFSNWLNYYVYQTTPFHLEDIQ
ncbi:MAG: homoserine O-succinyltransferase [Spirochaetales bacterium]|nr:homoserine O-succinyltransferase [Spirochaetales bacterium]